MLEPLPLQEPAKNKGQKNLSTCPKNDRIKDILDTGNIKKGNKRETKDKVLSLRLKETLEIFCL